MPNPTDSEPTPTGGDGSLNNPTDDRPETTSTADTGGEEVTPEDTIDPLRLAAEVKMVLDSLGEPPLENRQWE